MPTDDLVHERPELSGDEGEVILTEDHSVVVRWNGQDKPYRVPTEYVAPKES